MKLHRTAGEEEDEDDGGTGGRKSKKHKVDYYALYHAAKQQAHNYNQLRTQIKATNKTRNTQKNKADHADQQRSNKTARKASKL